MKKIVPYYYQTAMHYMIPKIKSVKNFADTSTLETVYKAESSSSSTGAYVCKFNHPNMAKKNELVSRVFRENNILVPEISARSYKDSWAEVYEMIPGRTLYDFMQTNPTPDIVQKIYFEAIEQLSAMADAVPYDYAKCLNLPLVSDITRVNTLDANGMLPAALTEMLVCFANRGKSEDKALYHCGLTPKNIIVSDMGELAGIVDMDEAAIADKHYVLATMFAKYKEMGYDPYELYGFYEDLNCERLNRPRIEKMVGGINLVREMLWKLKKKQKVK